MSRFWPSLDDLKSLGLDRRFFARTTRSLEDLAREILRRRGEASVATLAAELLEDYASTSEAEKAAFFETLLKSFGPDGKALNVAISAYLEDPNPVTAQALERAAEPERQALIRLLNAAPGGTLAIIRMREDLLALLPERNDLQPVDTDFEHLLKSWFNRGFLSVRRIDWHTPAVVLEKIIAYEAVHQIRDWSDLRRRLEDDRRCFAFFHPALPDEPLIFVEVALTKGLATSVQDVLEAEVGAAEDAVTATFYSISNCQRGLKNVAFGNFLLKQVVGDLKVDVPALRQFATLSPVPGFVRWLASEHAESHLTIAAAEAEPSEANKAALLGACAHYLTSAKKGIYPLDPVARFHLRNGAVLEQINWAADTSASGIAASAGIMVNYLYDEKRLFSNHETFIETGQVQTSTAVRNLAKKGEALQ